MSRRLWQTLIVSLLLSLAGLAVVLFWLGEPGDLAHLQRLSWRSLLGATLLLLVSFAAGGLRLGGLLRLAGARVDPLRATRAYILGLFAASITPSGGGNGPAIALSLQRDGVRAHVAWSAAVYSSVLDLFFYAWSIPVGALVLRAAGLLPDARLLWLAFALSAVCLLLWYGLAFHLGRLRRALGALFSLRLLRRFRRPVVRLLDDVSRATGTMARGHPPTQLLLHLLSLVTHGAVYAIFYVFTDALGSALALLPTLSVILLVSAAGHVVPTPGASGYLELALTYLFSRHASPAVVATAVIAYRAVSYYAAILLGAVLGGTVLVSEFGRARQPAAGGPPERHEAPPPGPRDALLPDSGETAPADPIDAGSGSGAHGTSSGSARR